MKKLVPVIGLEIHTELKTNTKMFCRCANQVDGATPNTLVCPACLGHPGTLPQPNQQAVYFGLLLARALNCQVNQISHFARKNYFYPDLPRGYQITQSDTPIGYNGQLSVDGENIFITRIHLEEDTGKLIHDQESQYSLVDYNRAGTPLIELVTGPVIRSAQQAQRFSQEFQKLLRYLGISGANMEKAEMRCEANISLQEEGRYQVNQSTIIGLDGYQLSNKVEIKNLNSFKALERAIDYEIKRQTKLINNQETVLAETRGWDESTNSTVAQRTKETATDYRYFNDPDLPPLIISDQWLEQAYQEVDKLELAKDKSIRWQRDYQINPEMANLLTTWPATAQYVDQVLLLTKQSSDLVKTAINWLVNELTKYYSLDNLINNPISPQQLIDLAIAINQQTINSTAGQKIVEELINNNQLTVDQIIEKFNLEQTDNPDRLTDLARQIIEQYPQQVSEYQAGKIALLQFFLGQMMRLSAGKANPQVAKETLERELNLDHKS